MSTTTTKTQEQAKASNGLQKVEESTIDRALKRIVDLQSAGGLVLPNDYSAENAVRSAWLLIQDLKDRNERPVLEVCTKESICNAFLDMVVKGLNPVKKQCYFIAYGNKLEMEESYMGDILLAKRDADVKEVNAVTIYNDDVFEYSITAIGRKKVDKHEQKIENVHPDKIKGAYAIVTFNDGSTDTEIMTIQQIRTAWSMGAAKGNSPAHNKFPDQMAEKTVIYRALKIAIGSSDDSTLDLSKSDAVAASVAHEIKENGNKEALSIEPETAQVEVTSSTINQKHEHEQVELEGPGF